MSVSSHSLSTPLLPVASLISVMASPGIVQAAATLEFDLESERLSIALASASSSVFPQIPESVADELPADPSPQAITSPKLEDGIPLPSTQGQHLEFALNFDLDAPSPPSIVSQPLEAARPIEGAGQQVAQAMPPLSATFNSVEATAPHLEQLFRGGSDSLVARVVGSAEGTRTVAGSRTWAYYGHKDPGNGVWNLGSFSYQHGANSPAEADRKQLERLWKQAERLRRQANRLGIRMNLVEELNAIDLANQSPRAALSRGGYVERLQQAHRQGLQGTDAVIWARTRSFLNPDTGRWQAPGLGNTERSITADQERRFRAIEQVLLLKPQH